MDREAERGLHKIVLITRKTRLTELIYRYNTIEQARFYIEHMGADFSDYLQEDMVYRQAVKTVSETALRFARVQEIDREFVPGMIFGNDDIVIAVGQDGLVANVMKYLDGQPLIGVNPDIRRWDGVLLPFEAGALGALLPRVIAGNYETREVTMARADTGDGQYMLAVNDLFIGCRSHASARYDVIYNHDSENQSSSGIIISTGLGATGWYRSVMAQSRRMAVLFGLGQFTDHAPCWEENQLTFIVREPYPSRSTQADIVYGRIGMGDQFQVISKMAQGGVIFSDGIENDTLEFNAGSRVRVSVAGRKGRLVVR